MHPHVPGSDAESEAQKGLAAGMDQTVAAIRPDHVDCRRYRRGEAPDLWIVDYKCCQSASSLRE